ncbi:MAG: GIY-YIG nuclease family protein [Candidatus Paceibacterota bacterium]|jgi:putative endonuclease
MFYYVYILESVKNKSLYIGYTNDLRRRFKQHNDGFVTYTRKYVPWVLIHYEAYRNKDDAMRREKYLKTSQGSRLLKRMLKEYLYAQGEKCKN